MVRVLTPNSLRDRGLHTFVYYDLYEDVLALPRNEQGRGSGSGSGSGSRSTSLVDF